MNKKALLHMAEWLIALAACAYLVYRLAIYDDYAALWASLRGMSRGQIGALLLCVALMPVNMAIEAWRWRTLWNEGVKELRSEGVKEISRKEAQRQVYYSKLAGLITPWRLGEYPARGVIMANESQESRVKSQESRVKSQESVWPRVLSMGAVGSATMTAAIIASGALAMIIYDFKFMISNFGVAYYILISAVFLLLAFALYFAPRLLRRWATVSHPLILISLGQSFVRLLCWCVQLGLVIWALSGGEISLLRDHVITNSFIYYLLVTVTPNVPIAEAGVRGAWAIVVFGTMNAAFAGVLLWGINTLLPCLIWPFLRKNKN